MDNESAPTRRGECRATAARSPWPRLLIAFAAIVAGAPLAGLDAPGLPQLPAEAAASLIRAELGPGKDASLLVQGSWEFRALGSLRLGFGPGGAASLAGSQPLLFMQSPDLLLSFLLLDSLYVEARTTDDLSQARYAAGWRSRDGSALRDIRIGNEGILFPDLPWLALGGGGGGSFGARANFASGPFTGVALVRYDQAERQERLFSGSAELLETVVDIGSFLRGRWLRLPAAAAGAASPTFYVESASRTDAKGNDGASYRKLEATEYSYGAATRELVLASASLTRILALYPGSDGAAPLVDLGAAGKAALLFDPERLDLGTELLARYARLDSGETEAWVRNLASGKRDADYRVRVEEGSFLVEREGDADGSRPFSQSDPWIYEDEATASSAWLHGPSREIVARRYGVPDALSIGADWLPGSVEVYRNGLPESGFSVDGDGRLMLAAPPGPADEIRVTWLRQSAERRTGSLAAGLAGRFELGPSTRAWLGLASRWSLPGESYAEGGAQDPGWVSLAGGLEGRAGSWAYSLSLAASVHVDEASGRYRVDGMESRPTIPATSTWTPASAAPAGFSALEAADESAAADFPERIGRLHGSGVAQRALFVELPAGSGAVELRKYLDPPPFGRLAVLSFLARGPAEGSLGLSMGDGSAARISVSLPEGSLSPTRWRRFVLRYGAGDDRVLVEETEGSALVPVPGASSSYDAFAGESGLATLSFSSSGVADASFAVDEIMLEESVGRLSAAGAASLGWSLPGFAPGGDAAPIRGLALSLESRGSLAGQGSGGLLSAQGLAGGGLGDFAPSGMLAGRIATEGGPIRVGLRGRAVARDGGFYLSGGHDLGFALGDKGVGLSFGDRFDLDPETGALGRLDRAELSLGVVGSLMASQEASWNPGAASSGGGRGVLSQEWKAASRLGPLLRAEAGGRQRARLQAPPPALAGAAGSDYVSSWMEGFGLLLPQGEASSVHRELGAGLELGMPAGAKLASLSLSASADPASDSRRSESAKLRLALPIAFGSSTLELFYLRAWSAKAEGAGSGLLELAELGAGDLRAALPLLDPGFLTELWSDRAAGLFDDALNSTRAFLEPRYAPQIGLSLTRPYGSSKLDLILPSKFLLSFRRELGRSGDLPIDAAVVEAKVTSGALNLFGSAGSSSLTERFESDEYLLAAGGSWKLEAGAAPQTSFDLTALASFYGSAAQGSPDLLSAGSSFRLSSAAAGLTWKESLDLTRSVRRSRHLLFDLYEAGLDSGSRLLARRAAEEGRKGSLVSGWLGGIASGKARARSLWSLGAELGQSASDSVAPGLGLALSQSYEERVSLPERLALSAKALLKETRDGVSGALVLEASLSLSLSLSF